LLFSSKSSSDTGAIVSPLTTDTASLTRPSPDSVPSRTLLNERRRRRRCLIIEEGMIIIAQMMSMQRVNAIERIIEIAYRRSMLGR
jgi:hypothetical protein